MSTRDGADWRRAEFVLTLLGVLRFITLPIRITTIYGGLLAHPLFVHVPVVLIPVTILAALVCTVELLQDVLGAEAALADAVDQVYAQAWVVGRGLDDLIGKRDRSGGGVEEVHLERKAVSQGPDPAQDQGRVPMSTIATDISRTDSAPSSWPT